MSVESTKTIKGELALLRQEIELTTRALNAVEYFNYLLSKQETIKQLNKNPTFWKQYERAIIVQTFIGIRRLFDNGQDAFSFHKFMGFCKENLEEFSLERLKARLSERLNEKSISIDVYVSEAYQPEAEDFRRLSKLVKENSRRVKDFYISVSTSLFAHLIVQDHEEARSLMREVQTHEIEAALISMWHVYQQIWQLYDNGRKPVFDLNSTEFYPFKFDVQKSLNIQIFGNEHAFAFTDSEMTFLGRD